MQKTQLSLPTERIDYYTDFKRLVRTDPLNRVVLLSIKDPQKEHPILPLASDDIETFKGSALCSGAQNDEELSDIISNLMGPGPWTINKEVPLPKSCGELHFTNKNKKSNITISHTLKVIFRVQRGDDKEIDPQTGKRKLFDIVVQTPIHILSVCVSVLSFVYSTLMIVVSACVDLITRHYLLTQNLRLSTQLPPAPDVDAAPLVWLGLPMKLFPSFPLSNSHQTLQLAPDLPATSARAAFCLLR